MPPTSIMSGAACRVFLSATAKFVYLRLHGPDHPPLYGGSYCDQDLGWWADRISSGIAVATMC